MLPLCCSKRWNPEKRCEFLHLIEKAGDQLDVMIAEILGLLIEGNHPEQVLQPLRLPQIAREIAAVIQPRIGNHNRSVDFPPEFPILETDPYWTWQVIRQYSHLRLPGGDQDSSA